MSPTSSHRLLTTLGLTILHEVANVHTRASPIDYKNDVDVLAGMGVHLTPAEANKVAAIYTDMAPMDRFLAETCQIEGQPGARQIEEASSSCQGTQGSKDETSRV